MSGKHVKKTPSQIAKNNVKLKDISLGSIGFDPLIAYLRGKTIVFIRGQKISA
jgi:hypothetical protein